MEKAESISSLDSEFIDMVDDNMQFINPKISEKDITFQKQLLEFITSVILKHETNFFDITIKLGTNHILCDSSKTIFQLISESTSPESL